MNENSNRKRLAAVIMATSFLLSSCSGGQSSDYSRARSLFNEGKYDEARALFSTMSDYENSTKYITYIDAWNAGKNGDYQKAYEGFRTLAGFLDSAEEAADFAEQSQQDAYAAALSQFRRGEYDDAVNTLSQLVGYEQADQYLDYANAMISARQGEYAAAIDAFSALGDFRDSAFQAEKWTAKQKEAAYHEGQTLLESGNFKEAASVFSSISDYEDATRYLKYADARMALSGGQYEEALKAFNELGLFMDSREQAEAAAAGKAEQTMNNAVDAARTGSYQEAIELLSSEDVKDHEEADQLLRYAKALQTAEQGEYDQAVQALEELGDYRDSALKIEAIQKAKADALYQKAVTLFQDGKADEAEELFKQTGTYADSTSYLQYMEALRLEQNREYGEAASVLRGISGFLDAGAKADADWQAYCAEAYVRAKDLFEAGSLSEAASLFQKLDGYEDAEKYLSYVNAEDLGRSGEYAKAEDLFLALEGFSDSAKRAEVYGLLNEQNAYSEAVRLFESGSTEEAASAFEKANGYGNSELYLRYLRGKQSLADGRTQEAFHTFEALGSFLDSKELAETTGLSLKKAAYEEAAAAFAAGNYEAAQPLFADAVPYRDAQQYVQYLSARAYENEGSLEDAHEAYLGLTDFLDSADRAAILQEQITNEQFQAACDLITLGRLDDARKAFEALSGMPETEQYLRYIEARKTEETSPDEAIEKYRSLHSFLDSENRIARLTEQKSQSAYEKALRMVTLDQLEDARGAFEALSGYKDSAEYVQYLSARILEEQGDQTGAASLYEALTQSFLDSAQRAENLDAEAVAGIYAQAVSTLEDGALDEARELFVSVYPYEESASYIEYIRAAVCEENEQYAAAAELFSMLGDFENSAERSRGCLASMQVQVFAKAENLASEGHFDEALGLLVPYADDEEGTLLNSYIKALQQMSDGLYADAATAFQALGDYKNCQTLAKDCREADASESYQKAVQLLRDGKMTDAENAFLALGDYADSAQYLAYLKAVSMRDHGQYAEAIAQFKELGDFEDSQQQIERAAQEETEAVYKNGILSLKEDHLDEAQACFELIQDYADSSKYLSYIQARREELQGNYSAAKDAYLTLQTGLLDSVQRAASCYEKEQDTQLKNASELMKQGKWQEALSILGTLKTDVTDDIAYCKAGLLMEAGKYEEARDAYLAIGNVRDSQSYAASCDTAMRNAAYLEGVSALAEDQVDTAQSAFQKAGEGYLDTEKYLSYLSARQMESAGQYAQAQDAYTACGDFLDAAERSGACHASAVKTRYLDAAVLLGQGRLKAARDIYETLDHYLQTDSYLQYIEARRLENAGETQKAADSFQQLGSFLDSEIRAEHDSQTANAAAYAKAQRFYQLGLLDRACELFASIRDYEDAATYENYLSAVLTYLDGDHLEKAAQFDAFGDFEDASDYAAYLRALQMEEAGQYEEAAVMYRAHASFLDCAERYLAIPSKIMGHDLDAASELIAEGRSEEAQAIYQAMLSYWSTEQGHIETEISALADAALERSDMKTAGMLYTVLATQGNKEDQDKLLSLAQEKYEAGDSRSALELLNPSFVNEDADALRKACHLQLAQEAEAKQDIQTAYNEYALSQSAERTEALEKAYLDAMNLLIDGDYLRARDAFAALHNLLDSEDRCQEATYRAAGQFEEEGRAGEASTLFAELGEYRDSASRVLEPYHVLALQLVDKGMWAEAQTAFEQADEGETGRLLIQKTQYEQATALVEQGDYEHASVLFDLAGDYLDSADRVQDVRLERGDQLLQAGAFEEAISAYQDAYPTSEAWERVQKAHYAWAESLEKEGERFAASEQFALAGEYLDAQERIREPFDQYGDALAEDGKYTEAVKAYLEAGNDEKTKGKILDLIHRLENAHLYDEALKLSENLGEEAGKARADTMLHKAEYLMTSHQWEAARDAFRASSMPEREDEPYEAWASSLLNESRFDEAVAVYDQMGDTQAAQNLIRQAVLMKADSLCAQGMYDEAYTLCMNAGETDHAVDVYLREGDALLEKGEYDAAVSAYEKAGDTAETTERIRQARISQGEKLLKDRQPEAAAQAFSSIEGDETATAKAQEAYQLASVEYLQSGKYEDAIRVYAILGDTDMEKAASYAYAQQLLTEGKWTEASAAFLKAGDYEDASSRISEPYLVAGNQLLAGEKFEEAIAMYAKAGDAGLEKISAAHYTYALRLMAENQYREASREFAAAGDYEDASARVYEPYMAAGESFLKEGKYAEAVAAFAGAGDAGLENLQKARLLYAEELANQEKWPEAEKQYLAGGDEEEVRSRLTEMYVSAGKTLALRGRNEEAISMYQKAGMESDSIMQELHYQIAVDALAHGEWDKAHDYFASAGTYKDAQERVLEPYLTGGRSLLLEGKYEEAISLFARAGDPGQNEILRAHYLHAEELLSQNAWDEASAEFAAAKDYQDAETRIYEPYLTAGDLQLAQGQYEQALSMFVRAGDAGAERISLTHQMHAEALMAEQKWDEANREFALVSVDEGAESRVNEPYLTAGDHFLAALAYDEAIAMYAKAGEDGEEKIKHVHYVQAEKLMDEQLWEKASAAFAAAGDYQDAAKRVYEPYFRAGDHLLKAQQWDEAIAMYAKAGDAGNEKIKLAFYAKAEALLKAQSWESASEAFSKAGDVLDAEARVQEPFLTAGDQLMAGGAYDEACLMYGKAGASDKVKEGYYHKAEALLAGRSWDEASAAFLAADDYQNAKDRVNEPFLTAGDELLSAQSFEDAIEMYSRAGKEGTEKIQSAYYAKAETLLHSLQWEEASAAFRAAGEFRDASSRVNEPFIKAGNLYLSAKAWDEAIGMFAKAGEEGAELIAGTHYLHAETLLEAQDWSHASAEFAAAGTYQDASKRVSEPYITAGDIALHAENYSDAVSLYSKAGADGAEKLKAAYYAYAESLASKNIWDEASHAFVMAGDYLDAKERITEPYRLAAQKAAENKDYELAAAYYQKAGDEESALSSLYTRAETLLAHGEWDLASKAFKACGDYKDAASRISEPYLMAGDACMTENRFDEAIRMYTKAGEDGKVGIQKIYYVQAEELLKEQKWDAANQKFLLAGDYMDAQERAYQAFKSEGDYLLAQGKSAEAFAAYSKAGEAGQNWIHEVHYNWAKEALVQEEWEKASQEFKLAADYMDASSRVNEPYYIHAKQLMAANDYIAAADLFEKAEGYQDAAVCAKEAWYQYAQNLLDAQEYEKASASFERASGYLNADEMSKESMYLLGSGCLENADPEGAYDALRTIRGYRDSDEILNTWRLRQVGETRTGKRSKFTVGRCIGLGSFLQSAGCERKETVEWQIIYRDDNRVLLTTRYIMTASAFGTDSNDYMHSKLRSYLNGTFLTECFDGNLLQSLIPQETLEGDRVFALSREECEAYLMNGKWMYKNRSAAKSWARQQGVSVSGAHHVGYYWLRDNAVSGPKAWTVAQDGSYQLVDIADQTIGVRPAIWIDLNVLYPQ